MLILALGCTQQTPPVNNTTACTQEAKICPDGSAVGRIGPNCEFAPCPQIVGNDSDAHGCKPSAGYSWCEIQQKCVREWETPCQTSPPGTIPPVTAPGSANFQRCISQCEPGNAGNGALCRDGCSMEEAAGTKSTSLCDALDNPANRPSCYGTVAKAAGDITICDRLTDATDKNYCLSVFGSPGAG